MKYLLGNDIGNAKTEIVREVEGELEFIRQDSIISLLPKTPTGTDENIDHVIDNLYDNLTVNFFSTKVNQNGVYDIGNKALTSKGIKRNMTIAIGNKSENDIPIIMSLSLIAALALKDHYTTNKDIPTELEVEVDMATAIPSSEYTLAKAKHLESRFIEGNHMVTIFVADKTVLVKVNVTGCKVTEEGKTSMLAFVNADDDILENYNETYNTTASISDFEDAFVLHTDIGDGTSEFVATEGLNPYASDGIRNGVGHATQTAIELYRDELQGSVGEITRQHFMQLLKRNNDKARIAKEKLEVATMGQATILLDDITNKAFVELTNSEADFFFVHGGGSIVFKDFMYESLCAFAEKAHAKVVWIPEKYATRMNSTGTYYLARAIFN